VNEGWGEYYSMITHWLQSYSYFQADGAGSMNAGQRILRLEQLITFGVNAEWMMGNE
jgi:hypothetical protein